MNSTKHLEKRRKKRRLIQEKVDILREIEAGRSNNDIAEEYNLTSSAICQIKKRRTEILNYANSPWKDQKCMKSVKNTKLEEKVLIWLHQRIMSGKTVTGPMICDQAKTINNELNGSPTFKASNGWLDKFKRRNGIKHFRKLSKKSVLVELKDYNSEDYLLATLPNECLEQSLEKVLTNDETGSQNKLYCTSVKEYLGNFVHNDTKLKELNDLHEKTEDVSAKEALKSLNKAYDWLEKQQECTFSDLHFMDKLRILAMQKITEENNN